MCWVNFGTVECFAAPGASSQVRLVNLAAMIAEAVVSNACGILQLPPVV
ncbi:hypothetical protein RSSM_02744 [Rhodopirellula sallentina SM41]|uniref:Uncharacterized protein n=1 Tax=Rhodopirellula sallentina SM41 TaxID=1263870 RepID=M5U2Z7_9BACT|nr:hypothetical protein RSSM_02744 [Rhodopirellula sallentina SM41]